MSGHMRTHPTSTHINHRVFLYLRYDHKIYAIPKNIAEKYLINENTVPAETVFAKLEKKLTKAGALLKGLRIREGLTQVAFAERIHVTQANLSNMENGHRPIGKIIAKRIEKIFGTDYRYFLE
jgi:DNA-binding XRE family transcriptional regulator